MMAMSTRTCPPNTQIYALTNIPGASYKYYGAMYEPNGGVLYGRTVCPSNIPEEIKEKYWREYGIGGYGSLNFLDNKEESAISLYTSLSDAYSVSYWSYMFKPSLVNGKHSLLIST